MKKNWRAENASDEDEKKSAWSETFIHADQHDQSDVNIQQSRTMKKDRRAENASDEDEKENAWDAIFKHVDQYKQFDVDIWNQGR